MLHHLIRLTLVLLLTLPALGQKIVYERRDDNNNFEIYSMNADGTGVTNLTQHPGLDRLPQWSPDGTKIAFVSERDGNQEVYVMDADGQNKVNLTQSPLSSEANPQWSPDGTMIAYNSNRDGSQQIFVMNADGTSQLRKTNEGGGVLSDARWSPSGSHIAYVASRATKKSIIVMDTVDFNPKVNLTLDLDSADNPRWSPDSQRIVFHAGPTDAPTDVYVMQDDGTGKINLTNHPANDGLARWSPDGGRILFVSNRDGNDEIYAVNPNGSNLINLSNSSTSGEGFPQWSPNGTRVLFSSNRDGGDLELYVVNADGTGVKRLTNAVGEDFNPEIFGDFSLGDPAIFPGGIVLANLAPKVEAISPLSIVSIFGRDFTDETLFFPTVVNGRIDTTLGGTCVEIGGERAPIFAVTPTQANVQTPATPVTGPVSVVVIRDCDTPLAKRSSVEMITVEEATPGFFIFNPIANDGFIAARFNATDSQLPAPVAPAGSFPTDRFGPSRPAEPGDIILLYGTGWGPTEPAFATGELATGAAQISVGANASVTLSGTPVSANDVLYVGVTPSSAGLFQLALRIPEGAQPGYHQVVLTVYGKSTPAGPLIPIAAP